MDAVEVLYRIGWSLFLLGAIASCAFAALSTIEDDDLSDHSILAAVLSIGGLLMVVTLFIWTGDHAKWTL